MSGTIFRVEKNKNYTVMSNVHLRDKNLSLKAKGLLSIMLSLPDDWDFTVTGLMSITGEGRDSIYKCLKELEQFFYLVKRQSRDSSTGRMGRVEYYIYESPYSEQPLPENPYTVNPYTANPYAEEPYTANPTQSNTKSSNTKSSNTESINPSIPSEKPEISDGLVDGHEPRKETEMFRNCERAMKESIGYDLFLLKRKQLDDKFDRGELELDEYDRELAGYDIGILDRVVRYIVDLIAAPGSEPVTINGDELPRDIVKSKLVKADFSSVRRVVAELQTNPTIRNPRSYAISMLYNS